MAEPLKIYENEAAIVAENIVRAPGTYSFDVELRGNALVSTIWVEAIAGATITATWKDRNPFTTALYTVDAHDPITTDGYHRKFIGQATHGVATLEIVVAGGSPKFGAFATANAIVGNFPAPDSTQNVAGNLTFTPAAAVSEGILEVATIAVADVEQVHTFPAGTRQYSVRARNADGGIKLGHAVGTSGTDYATIRKGSLYVSPEFAPAAKAIYFQSPIAGLVIELESWH